MNIECRHNKPHILVIYPSVKLINDTITWISHICLFSPSVMNFSTRYLNFEHGSLNEDTCISFLSYTLNYTIYISFLITIAEIMEMTVVLGVVFKMLPVEYAYENKNRQFI